MDDAAPMPHTTDKRSFYLSEACMMAYWALMSAVIALFFQSVPEWRSVLLVHLVMVPVTALAFHGMRYIPGRQQMAWRITFGLFFVMVAFSQLGQIVPFVNPNEFEPNLIRIDERIFGLNPQEWIEQYYHPALTEFLQVVYASYYFLPLFLFFTFVAKSRNDDAEMLYTALMMGFAVSYFLYMVVPARSPYIFAETPEGQYMLTYTEELKGLLLTDRIRQALHDMEQIKHDAFPSGHTQTTLILMFVAWRKHKPSLIWLVPIGGALVFSTVYLRYHYVIDLIAGACSAALIVWGAPSLIARWNAHFRLPADPTARHPAAVTPPEPSRVPADS